MSRKFVYLLVIGILALTLVPMAFSFWKSGMFDIINQFVDPLFWVGIIVFIAFILGVIFIAKRWFLNSLKPKDIPGGLPATATVIKSYQGNISMRNGVHQYYSLIIEVQVTNAQGETWPAKIEQVVPITQVGLFQPGLSFSVKYDPNNKSKVVIDQTKN